MPCAGREIVERCCDCAAELGRLLDAAPAFELLAPVRMNVVCFGLRDDGTGAKRSELLRRLHRDGRVFMTPTTLHGRPGIRAAFSNWRTTKEDVAIVFAALGEAVDV